MRIHRKHTNEEIKVINKYKKSSTSSVSKEEMQIEIMKNLTVKFAKISIHCVNYATKLANTMVRAEFGTDSL